ncbi:glycosyltransferase family 4 protein [Microbacterium sp.]|uniref:glycosyltransferase family 4 protein n=1 Tax=Microbacterium sp. TaxID=51671 RepID=UPI003A8F139D
MTARTLRFVVPTGVDDPARVSGGNVYDRHVRDGLGHRGWIVDAREVPDAAAAASTLRTAPDDTVVLVDGLVAGWAADAVAAAGRRTRLAVLAHMVVAAFVDASPAAVAAERQALAAAHSVITTSCWTADELVRRGLADRSRIVVAPPGVHPAPTVARPAGDGDLLCVGVVAPHKGHDTLLDALDRVDADWTCTIAGSTDVDADFASAVVARADAFGGRIRFAGVLDRTAMADAYRRSALLVAPSRVESAGMAIGEARARGIPVLATTAGGIPDTVAGGGAMLVPPGDAAALADALDAWMTDPALRTRLRAEARRARRALPSWDDTVTAIETVLEEL